MKLFEGKSKEERNKIIIAAVLGTLAVLALGNLIFSPFSGRRSVTVTLSPTPSASASPARRTNGDVVVDPMPAQSEIDSIYCCVAVAVQYPPGANDPGRNIFAFYEPPPPTPYSPTPTPEIKTPTPIPPTPAPTPNVLLTSINKQSVYAGENGFRLEVTGNGFRPDTPIWFGGTPVPTRFLSAQQLSADIPTNYIAAGRQANIEVRSADGKWFSNPIIFNIQQPPTPQFQYLGVVARRRGNNDSAYIMEQGKTTPSSVRLNDVIGGRFRLVGITPVRLLVQDISLTFLKPYQIEIVKAPTAGGSTTNPSQPGFNNNPSYPGGFQQGFPQPVQPGMMPNGQPCPPGIPCQNLRPYQPQPSPKDADDDNDDNDKDNQ